MLKTLMNLKRGIPSVVTVNIIFISKLKHGIIVSHTTLNGLNIKICNVFS